MVIRVNKRGQAMSIVAFCEVDKNLFSKEHNFYNLADLKEEKADICLVDIDTIFDYEENKHKSCKEKFISIAILDELSDYDAFKNFGLDSWIKRDDLDKINELIEVLKKRFEL